MKVEDLHTLKISIDNRGYIELRETEHKNFCALVAFEDGVGDFATEAEALRAAALFRSAHVMQEALRKIIEALETTKADLGELVLFELPLAKQALAMSENTAETI